MKTYAFFAATLLATLVLVGPQAYAWLEPTHELMSEHAALNSAVGNTDVTTRIGLTEGLNETLQLEGTKWSASKWIKKGANLEDSTAWYEYVANRSRSNNHFHNPLQPWDHAGLDNLFTGESALLWSQDRSKQSEFREGDWSLSTVREYFYLALVPPTDEERHANFARMFRGLGHQMHLIQDMAVPAHARNKVHIDATGIPKNFNRRFESWARAKEDFISEALDPSEVDLAAYTPTVPPTASLVPLDQLDLDPAYRNRNLSPLALLFDTDQYRPENPSDFFLQGLASGLNIGLAEYTNANFFSEGTISLEDNVVPDFKHTFPYPNQLSTNVEAYLRGNLLPEYVQGPDWVWEPTFTIKKVMHGEEITNFVKPIYFSVETKDSMAWLEEHGMLGLLKRMYYLNEACHADYVRKLAPRAVGYSAAFLNYFFRGVVEVTVPDSGIYALAKDADQGFRTIRVSVRNVTETGEEMAGGTIELVIKFKLADEDPFRSGEVRTKPGVFYKVVSLPGNANTIPRDPPLELVFDLCPGIAPEESCPNALPVIATDVYIQVVYKGKLGDEEVDVAVGFNDISEPTPIDTFNNTDMMCLYGNWYVSGSAEAIAAVDLNGDGRPEWDVYPHDLQNAFFKFSSPSMPQQATPTNFDLLVPLIEDGTVHRSYVLADDEFYVSNDITKVKKIPSDPWFSEVELFLRSAMAVRRQEGSPYPTYYPFRGRQLWGPAGSVVVNREYPNDTSCPLDVLQ